MSTVFTLDCTCNEVIITYLNIKGIIMNACTEQEKEEIMSNQEQTKAEKKSSLLNYVGNFIEKRDNQLRETVGEDGVYPLIDRFDEDSVVITNGEGDFRQINLVSIIEIYPKKNYLWFVFYRIIDHRNRLILIMINLVLTLIQLLKLVKVVKKCINNKFIYVDINHQHLILLIFKYKKNILNHEYNVLLYMFMLHQVKIEMNKVLHHLF